MLDCFQPEVDIDVITFGYNYKVNIINWRTYRLAQTVCELFNPLLLSTSHDGDTSAVFCLCIHIYNNTECSILKTGLDKTNGPSRAELGDFCRPVFTPIVSKITKAP